jgi:glycosyltransferase involved in cell wall biosynthesis
MRILMLSQFYPPVIGGEERHVRNLGGGLARRGHEVNVATQSHPGQPEFEIDEGVGVHRLSGTVQRYAGLFSETERRHAPPFPDPEFMMDLRRLIVKTKPEVVHAHNWIVHSFAPLKRWSGAPLALTLHDYGSACATKTLLRRDAPCDGPRLLKCLECAGAHYGALKGGATAIANWFMDALSPVDKLIAVSGAVADGNGLPARSTPYEVVPNFIPDEFGGRASQPDPALEQLPEQGFLLFVGDLRRQKGLHVLLEAYRRLTTPPPLVLIGRPCPDTPTELPDGARILTNWSHGAVMQAWERSLIGLAPSLWREPCATVVLEAMACGKPVIATDIGGMPDMVADEETGLLVAPNDATALSSAMARLIGDPDLAQRMGAAGRRKVVAFRAATIVPRIESIYRALVEGAHA